MPVTTTTVDLGTRLAEQAVAARGGADLFRFSLDQQIPEHAFKANDDGTVTVSGVDLLKEGTFNQVVVINANDLESMVTSFHTLSDAGIFVPPFRIDHSWSVLSVIGYFTSIETYRRQDTTDNLEKTFLRGDLVLTGSLDYKPAQIVDAFKRGALRNRSSEVGYYVTNSGLEIPWCFYGNAIVDIPAVEGLAPVQMSRRPEPHQITNLSDTGGAQTMTKAQRARLAALRAQATRDTAEAAELSRLVELEAANPDPAQDTGEDAPVETGDVNAGTDDGGGASAGDTGGHTDPTANDDVVVGSPDADTDADGNPVEGGDGTPAGGTETAPTGAPAEELDELAQARAEIAALRAERVTGQVAAFRASGVLNDSTEAAARTLLGHDSEAVRGAAGTLLGGIPAPVALGRRVARTNLTSSTDTTEGSSDWRPEIGMSKTEVGPRWAALESAQRKALQGAYDAWSADRAANGITD